MRFEVWIRLSVAVGLICAPTIAAQSQVTEVRIRVHSPIGERLGGALVALVDNGQRVVAEGVITQDGTRVLTAPAGSYRVRVRRIGFVPFLSEPITVPHSQELTLSIESPRVMLQSVVVTSRSACGAIDPNDRSLSLVWEEISKALRVSQLSTRDFEGIDRFFVYRSHLNAKRAVVRSDTTFYKQGNRKPFQVPNPAVIALEGYVLGDARSGWTYFAPDETILLSEHFARTHCFQVVGDPNRPEQIGIAFKPARGRNVPEIAGILWVDRGNAELREVTFQFVNSRVFEEFGAGGYTKFMRVPSGAWIVDDWALRAPLLSRDREPNSRFRIEGYVEDGGGVLLR